MCKRCDEEIEFKGEKGTVKEFLDFATFLNGKVYRENLLWRLLPERDKTPDNVKKHVEFQSLCQGLLSEIDTVIEQIRIKIEEVAEDAEHEAQKKVDPEATFTAEELAMLFGTDRRRQNAHDDYVGNVMFPKAPLDC